MLKCLSLPSLSSIVSKANDVCEWSIFRCSIPERPLGLVLHKQKTRPKRMPGTNTQHKYYGCKNCYNIESSFQSFEHPKYRIYHHRLHKNVLLTLSTQKRVEFDYNATLFTLEEADAFCLESCWQCLLFSKPARASCPCTSSSCRWWAAAERYRQSRDFEKAVVTMSLNFFFRPSCRTKKTTVFLPYHFIWRLFYKTFYGCN